MRAQQGSRSKELLHALSSLPALSFPGGPVTCSARQVGFGESRNAPGFDSDFA
jgi:hypothetical protein